MSWDTRLDTIVWQAIGESACPGDFRLYLRHAPEQAAHSNEALERLIELDDAGTNGDAQYPPAIDGIRSLAEAGDPAAQFPMGKILDLGLGTARDPEGAARWCRLAILQGAKGSMINLANEEALRGNHAEAKRLNMLAAEPGEPRGLLNLGQMHLHGEGGELDTAAALELF